MQLIRLRSLRGCSTGVSNEPFRRRRTLAYCRIYANFWFDITLTGRIQTVARAVVALVIAVDTTITISLCTFLAMSRSGFHPGCVPFSLVYIVSALFNLTVI